MFYDTVCDAVIYKSDVAELKTVVQAGLKSESDLSQQTQVEGAAEFQCLKA